MARISVLRYGHSLAELELFYVTALLLIDVLGEKGNPEMRINMNYHHRLIRIYILETYTYSHVELEV